MIRHLDRARFVVPSSKPGEEYVVDLEECYPNGVCVCRDYVTRCHGKWERTRKVVDYHEGEGRTRCKHITAVLLHLGSTLAQRLCAKG